MAKSVVIPVNTRAEAKWLAPNGCSGSFAPSRKHKPNFAYKKHSYLTPNNWESEDNWAARLFVGFSVDDVPTYDIEDLISIVKRVRQEQVGKPDASFLYQRGIYSHKEAGGKVVTEDGAQVILIKLDPDTTPRQFERQIVDLADEIRESFQQEEVIVEIQNNGLVKKVIGVDAEG